LEKLLHSSAARLLLIAIVKLFFIYELLLLVAVETVGLFGRFCFVRVHKEGNAK
jgi:hypothetical protein